MGTQQHVRIEIKGVVHRARRVVTRNVERLEIVVIVFNLRAFGNAVANVGEELLNTFQSPGYRMQTAGGLAATRQGHINGFGRQFGGQLGLLKLSLARIENHCDTLLGIIDERAYLWALLCRQIPQGLHHLSQFAFFTKVKNPDLLQGIDIFSALNSL
jgi:hypothetical protein